MHVCKGKKNTNIRNKTLKMKVKIEYSTFFFSNVKAIFYTYVCTYIVYKHIYVVKLTYTLLK